MVAECTVVAKKRGCDPSQTVTEDATMQHNTHTDTTQLQLSHVHCCKEAFGVTSTGGE